MTTKLTPEQGDALFSEAVHGEFINAVEEIDDADLRTEFDLPELADSAEEADALVVANAYLAALGYVEREITANDAEHERLIAYYRERHEERQTKLGQRADYLRGVLRTILTAYPPTKGKSRKLLAGTIGTRAHPRRVRIVDEGAVLQWAKAEHPEYVETVVKERVPAKVVQEYPDAPGVEVVPASDDFYAAPSR